MAIGFLKGLRGIPEICKPVMVTYHAIPRQSGPVDKCGAQENSKCDVYERKSHLTAKLEFTEESVNIQTEQNQNNIISSDL